VKCFVHPERDAVAACKHCIKGVCSECAIEGEGGTACSPECAEQVEFAHSLMTRAKANMSGAHKVTAILLLLTGCAFLFFGLTAEGSFLRTFLPVFGVIFLVGSLLQYRAGVKASAEDTADSA
jgi:hypothetical protein